MSKRVESSDASQILQGAEYAASRVGLWMANDKPVYQRVTAILAGEDHYAPRTPGGDVTERVAAFVEMLLYKDDGSTYRAMHVKTYGGLAGFEPHVPGLVRDSFTRDDFDGIDWREFAEALRVE